MTLRQFRSRQPIQVKQIKPHKWKSDPEVNLKHDDLYPKAWECEYDRPIFDGGYKILVTPNSPEVTVLSEKAADGMRTTPGTIQENCTVIIPQTDR